MKRHFIIAVLLIPFLGGSNSPNIQTLHPTALSGNVTLMLKNAVLPKITGFYYSMPFRGVIF